MKVSIIIAVYDEAPTISALLEQVWAQPIAAAKEIIIVESNSTDGTKERVAEFAREHAGDSASLVRVIYEPQPRGKGHAIRAGLEAATGDVILIQDGDLEYDVRDYPDLLEPILSGRAALVLGSRHLGADGWKIRKFSQHSLKASLMNVGGILFHALFNAVFGVRLTDPTTMFKVFRADCLEGLELRCNRFDFDYELLGKLLRSGFLPHEVPVSYRSRGFDEGKKIRLWRDPLTWVIAILRCRFSRLRQERPASQREAGAAGIVVEHLDGV